MSFSSEKNPTGRRIVCYLFFLCLGIELLFVILDLVINWWKFTDSSAIRRLFNITREDGIATLFAVLQTLALGLTCWIIFLLIKHVPQHSSSVRIGWLVLAVFFTYMAIDDGALIHERLGTVFKNSVDKDKLPSYGWQIILAPIFVLFGFFILLFLWQRSGAVFDKIMLIVGLSCLGLAVIVDFLEGTANSYRFIADLTGVGRKTFTHFAKSFEEFIEMLGITFLWLNCLRYLFSLSETLIITWHQGKLSITPAPHPFHTEGSPDSAIATSSSL